MSRMKQRTFPKNFLWGAATAAHQVEGGNQNQWTAWERANAERLARTAEQRYGWMPSWPRIQQVAEVPENYISNRGVEHYSRYKEDFKLLKQLNMNAFRFSIEWSRIEPEEGRWDEREIEHYRQYLAELKRQGIEPIVTLWHWTMPIWFVSKGDFEKRRNIRYFERFVAKVTAELGGSFTYVTLLNEPNAHAVESYIRGNRPPNRHNFLLAMRVYYHLALAHRRAYRVMKRFEPSLQVGIAFALTDVRPARPKNILDRLAVRAMRYAANWWFINRIRSQLDFIGVNYYFTSHVNWRGRLFNADSPKNDLGWYMEPSGLADIMIDTWRRYRKPLLVTENGLADAKDAHRQWWLEQTVEALQRTLAAGVDLRGYLHWSLLDNFEWEQGYWPQFGLITVDRKTMKRTVRPSARWFASYIASVASRAQQRQR